MVKSDELLEKINMSFQKGKKKQISLMIREPLVEKLRKAAEEEGTSMSDIVNHLLLIYLRQKELETV